MFAFAIIIVNILQYVHIGKATPTDTLIYLKEIRRRRDTTWREICKSGRKRVARGRLKLSRNDLLHLVQRVKGEGVEICAMSDDVDKIADS